MSERCSLCETPSAYGMNVDGLPRVRSCAADSAVEYNRFAVKSGER